MASVRNIKKDIDVVMSLALSDCFYVLEYNDKVDEKAILEIAGEIIKMHRELRLRVNNHDGKDNPKLIKKYYQKIIADLLSSANGALERLSSEVKKVA